MVYFISDLHFGHENIIKLCSRPFESVEEMDWELIRRWNLKVGDDDLVYICGDIVWGTNSPYEYLPFLNGKKILICGNHDGKMLKNDGAQFFESVHGLPVIREGGRKITLCHYPMYEWEDSLRLGSKRVGWHIYGHIHNNYLPQYRQIFLQPHALNASAEVIGYAPATFDELRQFNRAHKVCHLESLYDKALFIASECHMEQLDKAGAPYINHPLAVSKMVEGEREKVVALLHDVIEDGPVTAEYLGTIFPEEIVSAVVAMTKREGEDYFDYIRRAAANPIARAVKLADLAHNMDFGRFKKIPPDYAEKFKKYLAAKHLIEELSK